MRNGRLAQSAVALYLFLRDVGGGAQGLSNFGYYKLAAAEYGAKGNPACQQRNQHCRKLHL
jgi:hypothetical protein